MKWIKSNRHRFWLSSKFCTTRSNPLWLLHQDLRKLLSTSIFGAFSKSPRKFPSRYSSSRICLCETAQIYPQRDPTNIFLIAMAEQTFSKSQTVRRRHIIQNFGWNHLEYIQWSCLSPERQQSPRFDKLHWSLKSQEKTHRVWPESFQRAQSKWEYNYI